MLNTQIKVYFLNCYYFYLILFRCRRRNHKRVSHRRTHHGYRFLHLPNHLPRLPSKEEEAAETSSSLSASPSATTLRTQGKDPPRHSADLHVRRERLTSGGIRQFCPLRSKCRPVAIKRINNWEAILADVTL